MFQVMEKEQKAMLEKQLEQMKVAKEGLELRRNMHDAMNRFAVADAYQVLGEGGQRLSLEQRVDYYVKLYQEFMACQAELIQFEISQQTSAIGVAEAEITQLLRTHGAGLAVPGQVPMGTNPGMLGALFGGGKPK